MFDTLIQTQMACCPDPEAERMDPCACSSGGVTKKLWGECLAFQLEYG